MVTLYSTGCPKCKVLQKKLTDKQISFEEINDISVIESKGITQVPILEVDNKIMDFSTAVKWINQIGE